mmetsp:Transcript_61250/g.177624  ORF Transcript_61250/g.177624 Transcript_61250/m.177624 type:complete len:429 (+) Transcript_61250:117-1403(+)
MGEPSAPAMPNLVSDELRALVSVGVADDDAALGDARCNPCARTAATAAAAAAARVASGITGIVSARSKLGLRSWPWAPEGLACGETSIFKDLIAATADLPSGAVVAAAVGLLRLAPVSWATRGEAWACRVGEVGEATQTADACAFCGGGPATAREADEEPGARNTSSGGTRASPFGGCVAADASATNAGVGRPRLASGAARVGDGERAPASRDEASARSPCGSAGGCSTTVLYGVDIGTPYRRISPPGGGVQPYNAATWADIARVGWLPESTAMFRCRAAAIAAPAAEAAAAAAEAKALAEAPPPAKSLADSSCARCPGGDLERLGRGVSGGLHPPPTFAVALAEAAPMSRARDLDNGEDERPANSPLKSTCARLFAAVCDIAGNVAAMLDANGNAAGNVAARLAGPESAPVLGVWTAIPTPAGTHCQ